MLVVTVKNEKSNFLFQAINEILSVKFALPDGRLTYMIVKSKKNPYLYDCLLCSIQELNSHNLIHHTSGRRHLHHMDFVNIVLPRVKGENGNLK